jgi:PPOX class probable F420-dependent enzyme
MSEQSTTAGGDSASVYAASGLDRESYISLGTFRKNGTEVRTPVWFAEAGGRIYVFSEAHVGKVKRIKGQGRVRVAGCNVRGAVHGDWWDGDGMVVRDSAEIERGYRALHAKYGWQMKIGDFFSRLTGRIDNRALLGVDLTGRG